MMNNLSCLRELSSVVALLHGFREFYGGKIAEPVDLVFDSYGEDLGMVTHIWSPDIYFVVDVVKVLHHHLDNVRVITGIVTLETLVACVLDGFELDDTAFTFLLAISKQSWVQCYYRVYLEGARFESSLEIVRLHAENNLVGFEMMRSADNLAIREFFRFTGA